jgi:low temperature requirement protein LtrA
VLGEVVVGVVDGLSEVERDLPTIATAILGLTIGFGFWWTYFDLPGPAYREPEEPWLHSGCTVTCR